MTGPLPLHRDPEVVSAANAVLAGLAAVCRPLRAAAVFTDDGFEIARVPQDGGHLRFASMASSLQALADAVVRELHLGTTDHVLVAASGGAVVALRVPGQTCALVVVLDDEHGPDEVAEVRSAALRLGGRLGPAL